MPGSAAAAVATAFAWRRDNLPALNVSVVASNPDMASAVCSTAMASPTLVPSSDARYAAIDAKPSFCHRSVPATRSAANALPAAPRFSSWTNNGTIAAASRACTTAGSNPFNSSCAESTAARRSVNRPHGPASSRLLLS